MSKQFITRKGFISKSGSTVESYLNVSGNTTSPAFVTIGGVNTDFVKGDGSLDSNTYLTSGDTVGYVDTTGTPLDNQIATFIDADTIEGTTGFTYDGASVEISGTQNTDAPTLGVNLAIGETGSGTNWSGTDLVNGYTHTSGSTDALVTTLSLSTTKRYFITITTSGRTQNRLEKVDCGGIVKQYLSGNQDYVVGGEPENTAVIYMEPQSGWDGTVSIKVQEVTPSTASLIFKDSGGTVKNEVRVPTVANAFHVGANAGENMVSGNNTFFLGTNVGQNNVTAGYLTAAGTNVLGDNSAGQYVAAYGYNIFQSSKFSAGNKYLTAYGGNIGNTDFKGTSSTLIGWNLGLNATGGTGNQIMGYAAMEDWTTGSHNVSIGDYSLRNITTGNYNIALGSNAGRYIDGGGDNILGQQSIFIGYNTRAAADNEDNQIVIGYTTIGNGEDTVTIGNIDITDNYFNGNVLTTSSFSGTSFITDGGTASQFVKGDGTLDSNTYSLTGHTHDISDITGFTDNSTNWDSAYQDTITGMTVTGTTTKTISLFQRDGDLIQANFTDASDANTDDFTTGATFNAGDGVLEFTRQSGATYNVDIDGRYLESLGVGAGLITSGGLTPNINLALSALTDGTADIVGAEDEIIYLDNGIQKRKQVDEWNLSDFNNDLSAVSNTDDYLTGATFNTSDGLITMTRQSGSTVTVDIDGRYSLTGHGHDFSGDYLPLSGGTMTGIIADFESTGIDDNATSTAITIDSGEKVGIGETSPDSPLHVYENTSQTGIAAGITIENAGGGDAKVNYIAGGTTYAMGIDNSDSDKFKINNATSLGTTPLITLDGSNVGISQDTPTYPLEVDGNVAANSFISSGGTSSDFVKGDGSLDSNTYLTSGDLIANTDDFVTGATFNTGDGVLTMTRQSGSTFNVDLDGRYYEGSITPAALTKVNDTNVTLTLGGTPATALLEATSLSLGWTGTLADGRITSATNWNAAYNDKINSAAFNTGDGILTLTQQDAGTVTVDLDGRYITSAAANTDDYLTGATFNTGDGVITHTLQSGSTVTVDIDGRYMTSIGVGAGLLSSGGLSPNLNLALSALTDGTGAIVGTQDEIIYLDNGVQKRKQVSEWNLSDFTDDLTHTPAANDATITIGGGSGLIDSPGAFTTDQSGNETITLNVGEGVGITVNASDVAIDYLGTDNFIDAATNLEGSAIATSDTIVYHDATDNNVKKGLISDLPFASSDTNYYLDGVTVNSISDVDFTMTNVADITGIDFTHNLASHSDVVSATNTDKFALMANGTTGYVGRLLVEADISDFGTYNNYVLPEATATVRGGLELFSNTDNPTAANSITSTASRTYGLQLNSSGQGVINVPWTDTQNTYTATLTAGTGISATAGNYTPSNSTTFNLDAATTTVRGGIELEDGTVQTTAANAVTSTASRTYGLQVNSGAQGVINVPWTDTTYTTATATVEGLIELEDNTVQTTAANAVTTTASRTYGLQLNSSGQGVINVPWTDNNDNDNYYLSALGYTSSTSLLSATISGGGSTPITVDLSNLIEADALKVTGDGTTSQWLRSDADGSFSWVAPPNDNDNDIDYINSASWNSSSGLLTLGGVGNAGATAAVANLETYLNANLNFGTGDGDMLLGTIQTVTAAKTFNNGTLLLDDSDSAFDLVLASTSTITSANKTLTFDVNNANRTLTIAASGTINGGTHSGTNTGDGTYGIADTNYVKIDSASVVDNHWARFTATGLEGRTDAQVADAIQGNLAYATATVRGVIELEDNTVQTVAANAVTATASRTYGLQLNSSNQAVVNVPWTDSGTIGGTATNSYVAVGSGTNTIDGSADLTWNDSIFDIAFTSAGTTGIGLKLENTSTGDVPILFTNNALSWTIGVDATSDKFSITEGTALGTSEFCILSTGTNYVGIQNDSPNEQLTIGGSDAVISINDMATAPTTINAGYGKIWVKSASPNELWFTDDDGDDWKATKHLNYDDSVDNSYDGITFDARNDSGVTLYFGEVCYFSTEVSSLGYLKKADSSNDALMPAMAMYVGSASISNAATGTFLLQGFATGIGNYFPTFTNVGSPLFLSGVTPGRLSETAPSGGDFAQILGISVGGDTVYFNPSYDIIET